MRKALRELTFADENLEENIEQRDAVLAALPSDDVLDKKNEKNNKQGLKVMSFRSLILNLGKVSKCEYEINYDKSSVTPPESLHRTFKAISQKTVRQQKSFGPFAKYP